MFLPDDVKRFLNPPNPVEEVTDIHEIIENSKKFEQLNPFPVQTTRIHYLKDKVANEATLLSHINGTYPLIHQDLIPLFVDFINFKINHGTSVEKSIYNQEMNLPKLVDRLLEKRPLVFCGSFDHHTLRNSDMKHGVGMFDGIGKENETPPYVMKDYLSYDEIKLSALIGTSGPTVTINKGDRYNCGEPGFKDTKCCIIPEMEGFQKDNVFIVGLVGTRFERLNVMESQDMFISSKQNTADNNYYFDHSNSDPSLGRDVFAKFYGIKHFPTFDQVKSILSNPSDDSFKMDDFHPPDAKYDEFLHKSLYQKRIQITAETLFIEANDRAIKSGEKSAYVHVVGLGLGVWKKTNEQCQWYVDAFGKVLKDLNLEFISDVDFSWIKTVSNCCGVTNGGMINEKTKIRFSTRDLFEKIDKDKILVVCWAYDGNSYPGNEYWDGSLSASGDPQAACASQVPELHNPLINTKRFRGDNLHIATKDGKVLKYLDFYKKYVK